MPTAPCPTDIDNPFFKRPAQTLFLGASVAGFNTSMGWDGQPSQLTVNLIEDDVNPLCAGSDVTKPAATRTKETTPYIQFPGAVGENPGHFDTCSSDPGGSNFCFIDKTTGNQATAETPIENRIYPGKVYYKLTTPISDSPNNPLVSFYHKKTDPGFFGNKTRMNINGVFNEDANHPNYKYDIIDTPVYFKSGNFTFGGFVQSWSSNVDGGGKKYTVIINGPQTLLNSCHLILDSFGGSIFSKSLPDNETNFYGGPKNFVLNNPSKVIYDQLSITKGNIPNLFNIYGFLESYGPDNFGYAKRNEQGLSVNKILTALMVLTSTTSDSVDKLNIPPNSSPEHTLFAPKSAFSPYGRIIGKCMQIENIPTKTDSKLYNTITDSFNSYGVVPPQDFSHFAKPQSPPPPTVNQFRCQFALDIYDLMYDHNGNKRLPDSFRIDNPIITISELLNIVAENIGHDIFTEMIPIQYDNKIINVIKVRVISRLKQPDTNTIASALDFLSCAGIPAGSVSYGKEKNDATSRSFLIGGNQQRLLQVKSYRLAYTQTNFVYNPTTKEFVNYFSLKGNPASLLGMNFDYLNNPYGFGKIRFPNFTSTRNKLLMDAGTISSQFLNTSVISTLNEENNISPVAFKDEDVVWSDVNETNTGIDKIPYGNYDPAQKNNHPDITTQGYRWFPLFMDNICPFFGYTQEENVTIKVDNANNVNNLNRIIRPVWFDSWTGQIAVLIRASELPKTNVSLDRNSLRLGPTDTWNLPYSKPAPVVGNMNLLDSLGIGSSPDVQYFVLTESEMRAALAGFDNFLVYSLSKTYKTDLIEMVRRAYFIQVYKELILAGSKDTEAINMAQKETDWYWKLMGGNIAGDLLYPTAIHPDKTDGAQYIQEKALQDLKILHKFVASVAKYYGKKYMVKAPYVNMYKDEELPLIGFKTSAGYGYVFSGQGKFTYNYTPTNDGAWEEYGNIIDDCIAVGSPAWYQLTDDSGKIKPLLGYNNNPVHDYIREAKCKAAAATTFNEFKNVEINPYFDYQSWLMVYESKTTTCSDSFIFPSLDLSELDSSEYVNIQLQSSSQPLSVVGGAVNNPQTVANIFTLITSNKVPAFDAFNNPVGPTTGAGILNKSKVYVTASVEENFVFLSMSSGIMNDARILIDSPGLNLTSSTQENAKDLNRTVLSNIAIEDILVYLYTTPHPKRDFSWLAMMLNYATPIVIDDADNPYILGLYTVSSNSTASNVELAPKAAHPFFAGIPIKSNQFVYGPWTNYPHSRWNDIYTNIVSNANCSSTQTLITLPQASAAINNLITNLNVEIKDDYVPWNFGGMYALDIAASQEIESKTNYQSVIETAQLDIAGLPLFNLGGLFASGNDNSQFRNGPGAHSISYTDLKYGYISTNVPSTFDPFISGIVNLVDKNYSFKTIRVTGEQLSGLSGPIINSIQCSVGSEGLKTTYNFRTYTRKIGLFNKESIERIKKLNLSNLKRNKEIAKISQSVNNLNIKQDKFLLEERLNKSQFGNADLASKLFGWSPGLVLIGQAHGLIDEPSRSPKYIEDFTLNSNPGDFQSRTGPPATWSIPSGSDQGDDNTTIDGIMLSEKGGVSLLKNTGRIVSTVQLYERKEVDGQLNKQYGSQAAMSLDGLLSPISFFPTFKNGTFAYSKYDTVLCPICKGTKKRKINAVYYTANARMYHPIQYTTCEYCSLSKDKLNVKLIHDPGSTTAGVPINCVTYNPIIVPYGEFKNINHQSYSGVHPEKAHDDISAESDPYQAKIRPFFDRLRHCIEIVARGSIPPGQLGYGLETSRNLNKYNADIDTVPSNNLDYFGYDIALYDRRARLADPGSFIHEMNQRFMGLRGPLVLHSWGYDTDGYPVPNAADEPFAIDKFGRPKRFKLKVTKEAQKQYKDLPVGKSFIYQNTLYSKNLNGEYIPSSFITLNSTPPRKNIKTTITYTPQYFKPTDNVIPVIIEDDLSDVGGFDPGNPVVNNSVDSYTNGYKGSIISKTQKFTGGKWSEKKKLKDFYLNWGERPDLWNVGPIDLKWDEDRHLWVGGGQGGAEEIDPPYIITNSNDIVTLGDFINKKSSGKFIYRMIYATLEEDLIKQPDFDETYATRAFIDDVEFSSEPLARGFRRLIYIKDKTGYTAPKGTKLLCRYNKKTGFYEPVSKPINTTTGKIISSSQVLLDMLYIPGRRGTNAPQTTVNYSNPLLYNTSTNDIGIFTFIDGKWILSSIKQN